MLRVLGVLGALDPHKHKMNLGLIQMGESGTVLSMSDPKTSQDPSQDGKDIYIQCTRISRSLTKFQGFV